MQLNGKRVLVTGAGGFIGSHLCERLLDLGAKVSGMVFYSSTGSFGFIDSFQKEKKANIKIMPGDLRDTELVKAIVKGHDVVFHLAALVSIPYSYEAPRSNLEVNTIGSFNLMQACLESQVSKVVHTSTSEVYGTARHVPITEQHLLQAQSPYSASKIAADKIAEAFYDSYGLPIVTIRPFNVFGPRQSARAVIPTIISQCLSGGDVSLGSLEPTRDFTYVTDTVEAFVKAAKCEKAVGETINVGSGTEISIGNLAKKIITMVGNNNKIKVEEQRIRPKKSEIFRLVADNSKAKRLLGWKPSLSMDSGLGKTITWFKGNIGLYKPGIYAK